MSTTISFPLVIPAQGSLLAARVYRGTDDLFERQPVVVITGSWLTVKEQMADIYARALADRGYTAITFDFTGWGESSGDLRQAELPSRKIADIDAVVRFASTLSFVRSAKVAYLAVCASAQYALAAVAQGAPISSFASVAGWFHDTASVAPFYGDEAGLRLRLGRAQSAWEEYLRTGASAMVPAYDEANDRAGMFLPMDYYANPARGAVPAWANQMAELSWSHWLTFDGMAAAGRVDVPSLFVHSDGCVFPDHIRSIAQRMPGPAELVWGEGSQIDFYDQPTQVDFAVRAVDEHLRRTLAS